MIKQLLVAWFAVWVLWGAVALVAGQLVAVGSPPQMVVEYNALESAVKLTSSMDFADTKVMFTDLPGRWVTMKELRDWVKTRPVGVGKTP